MRCQKSVSFLVAAGLTSVLAATGDAHAQTPQNTNVPAEALFEEARTLVSAGKYAEACPKFADSERLGPSVATLLNLANCWERLGRTATAWATYREAASAADASGRKDYLATAQRRAEGLAPKLARLFVTVAQPASGLQVKRDGVVVDSAEWGVGIPVDTGPHTVEAVAPGRKSWSITVDVAQDGAQSTVGVPPLEEAPPGEVAPVVAPPVAGVASPPTSPPAASPPFEAAPPSGLGSQRVASIVVAGAGVLGLAAGGILGLVAKGKYNDSLDFCLKTNPDSCDMTGMTDRDSARSTGNVATVFVGAGAAAVIVGGVLWFTAPRARASSSAATFVVSPTLGGFVARGAW